jgi:hypothetical protein
MVELFRNTKTAAKVQKIIGIDKLIFKYRLFLLCIVFPFILRISLYLPLLRYRM